MDKILNNRWAVKLLALVFALLLYGAVNSAQAPTPKKIGESFFPTSTTDEATLTDIPVKAYYDDEKYVVTGVPQTVNVTIKGSTSAVKTARQTKNFEIYADMQNLSTGTHKVELKARDVSKGLTLSINPSVTTVTIQEKTTAEFPVETEFYNQNKIKDGYSPEQPIVNPKKVTVTGSKDVIDKISVIKAFVNLEDVDQQIEKEAKLTVYDSSGNELPVELSPSVVNITVPISSPSKKVPFKIERTGSLPDGISISSIETSPSEVTVYGSQKVLDSLDFIDGVKLDLSKIKDDTEIDADIPIPDGVKKVSPETVKIKVKVATAQEKKIDNVPISIVGLSKDLTSEFVSPSSGRLTLTAKGSKSAIDKLKASDVEAYINVGDLNEGTHEVTVQVNGPQNVTWTLSRSKVKVKLTSTETEDQPASTNDQKKPSSDDDDQKEKSKEESTQDKAKKESSQRQRIKEDKKEDEASS
ncbi:MULTISPECIES: CdaR family protein [Bacillus]|uniref:YbbR-like domain-containing protein YbbR n=1 Tax=Bacillus pumilus (strain SAFR-032) TaxID=315750 RepID=A8F9E5_BACP2|nr:MULTISPECIES: YbbR-like domain-containing protein [Bacillus]ABV60862.1 YbbR-like domain-containing protein YbbR [Bacillus pumilus SAFR-032]AVI39706.1 YbbR-like domain-containing protein [Bacillus pumilus]MBC3643703.1 YbbR-like domain-containing protein [Bacillus pumilus]MBC3646629.1 YbbR-like domain-containing protein [Bacillus pumilus]MBC3650213.1 YbbR-like domain-containing protein [Bacillus pumilus]